MYDYVDNKYLSRLKGKKKELNLTISTSFYVLIILTHENICFLGSMSEP